MIHCQQGLRDFATQAGAGGRSQATSRSTVSARAQNAALGRPDKDLISAGYRATRGRRSSRQDQGDPRPCAGPTIWSPTPFARPAPITSPENLMVMACAVDLIRSP
jgi:hypothetical protein